MFLIKWATEVFMKEQGAEQRISGVGVEASVPGERMFLPVGHGKGGS